MNKSLLKKYARLIVRVGANVARGNRVVVYASVEQSNLATEVVREAYRCGAESVTVEWSCDEITRLHYTHRMTDVMTEIPKWEKEKEETLSLILASKDGREVKNCEAKKKLYRKVRKAFVEAHGEENWDLYAWRIACEAVKVKYEYCPEFREYVDDNRDKLFVENSFWKKIPKAGVLKVTDENSPYFGKYIGCNFTGVAIQRCVE